MKKLLPVFAWCWLLASGVSPLSAQADAEKFRALSAPERFRFALDLPLAEFDSARARQALDRLLPVAEAAGDARSMFALTFLRFRERSKLGLSQPENFQILAKLEALAARGAWPVEQSVARHYAFFEDFVNKKISLEQAYLEVENDFERMESIGFQAFEGYQPKALLFHLAKFMWDLDDREKALRYFTAAERCASPGAADTYHLTNILNHIQTYHQQKRDFPRAIEYAQKIIALHQKEARDSTDTDRWFSAFWEGLASLDLASMLVEQGRPAESEPYAARGYELANSSNADQSFRAWHAEFDALQVLLSVKLKTGGRAEIEPLVRRSEWLKAKLDGDPDGWYFSFKFVKYYQNLARWHELRGDLAAAMHLSRTAQALSDSLDRRNDARKFEQLGQRREAEKYALRIREIEREKQAQRQLLAGMAAILLLLALVAWLNFKRLQAGRAEAEAAKGELAALARNFQEKSAVADALRGELENRAARDERSEHLEALAHTVILTEEDWSRFRALFERVHPGFLEGQKKRHPELSPAELRLLALEKLELGDHEIGNLLGVSVKTVHQTRWRLRKKLGG